MQGIERTYCDVCINALVGAWRGLMEASGGETLRKVPYGKGDSFDLGATLGLDAIPEITIAGRIKNFDQHAIFITEELDSQAHRRWPTDSDPIKQPLMFFCDPTDRSIQLEKFFDKLSKDDPTSKVGHLLAACEPEKAWEGMFETPASITAPTGAITCVRKGEVVFSVILGYITGTVYVASDAGIFSYKLRSFSDNRNETLTLTEIVRNGKALSFPSCRMLGLSPDDCKRFVTFLGKTGYQENLNDSEIFPKEVKVDDYVHHREPPGPPRTLYLSELQSKHGPIGFILCNGEKIGEWMHWLAFVKYAKNEDGGQALRTFEISLGRPWTKYGMLMSTSQPYSIFSRSGDKAYLDISRLRNFERPSQFRCMMAVVRHDNERIIHVLQQHQYREVTNFF